MPPDNELTHIQPTLNQNEFNTTINNMVENRVINIINTTLQTLEHRLEYRLRDIVREEINGALGIRRPISLSPELRTPREQVGESVWRPPSTAQLERDNMNRDREIEHRRMEQVQREIEEARQEYQNEPVSPYSTSEDQQEILNVFLIPEKILKGEKEKDIKENITRTDLIDLE